MFKGLFLSATLLTLFFLNDSYAAASSDKGVGFYVEKAKKGRSYETGVTNNEIEDIRFIVTTLSDVPLLKLRKYESQLKTVGNRVDHVHPLNFWKVIFTDSRMISSMHNIKRRTLVWKQFIKGMGESLQEEKNNDNLKEEYIRDFTEQLAIPFQPIAAELRQGNWKEFVKLMLDFVPREEDTGRYDM